MSMTVLGHKPRTLRGRQLLEYVRSLHHKKQVKGGCFGVSGAKAKGKDVFAKRPV